MNEILIVGTIEDDVRQLEGELSDTYGFTEIADVNMGFIHLLENKGRYSAVLIDHPSIQSDDVVVMIDYLSENSLGEDAVPVLIFTDEKYAENDLTYLGGAVIDCIERPFILPVVKRRIWRSLEWINSVSFGEFAKMLKALPANIYLKDRYGKYVFSSQTWQHLDTGDDPNWTIVGKTDLEIRKDKENAKKALDSDLKLIESGIGSNYIIQEGEGETLEYLQIIKEPLFEKNGKTVKGIIALINNVTEQELMRRKLEKIAVTDTLTGLYTKIYAVNMADEFGARDQEARDSVFFVLMYADMNHFKPVNDTYGHEAGDVVLKEMGNRLLQLPEEYTVIRIGGDEFLIVLRCSDDEDEIIKKAKAVSDIFKEPVTYQEHVFHLSVSIGIARYPNDGTDPRYLVRCADAAMYDVKRSENREDIRFFEPHMMENMEGVQEEL